MLGIAVGVGGLAFGCNFISGANDLDIAHDTLQAPVPKDAGTGNPTIASEADADEVSPDFPVDAAPYDAGAAGYIDVAGTWRGVWLLDLTLVGGPSTMDLKQDGGSLTGTADIQGGICPRRGTITGGFVAPNRIAGTFTSDDGVLVLLLQSTISADKNTLDGRFTSVGACLPGAAGSSKVTRSSPSPATPH